MATLYNLPAEVRNMVFEEIFARESSDQSNKQNELAIFRVSKQLHFEASSYFYATRQISITIPSSRCKTADILPPISKRYLRFVRHLEVHLSATPASSAHTCKVASSLEALTRSSVRLTTLRISIESTLSRLLNGRVDDAIIDDHRPILASIHLLLRTGTASQVQIDMQNCGLAPGVPSALLAAFGTRVSFCRNGAAVQELFEVEWQPTGRASTTHLADLGFEDADVAGYWIASTATTPTPLSSSIGSALSSLDTFSASSFGAGGGDDTTGSGKGDGVFFDEEEFDNAFDSPDLDSGREEAMLGEMDNLDGDEEMEDRDFDCELEEISAEEVESLLRNQEEAAHWVANQYDVDYMVNFAPELLLGRHHLGQGS